MVQSFWTIPTDLNIRTPLSILREQANALTQQTNAALYGEVSTLALDSTIYITLEIQVPALNGYKVEILEYEQPVHMYPGRLKLNLTDRGKILVEDEEKFVLLIKNYLSSKEMARVIQSLLAQVQQN
jgi:hypothetical protein